MTNGDTCFAPSTRSLRERCDASALHPSALPPSHSIHRVRSSTARSVAHHATACPRSADMVVPYLPHFGLKAPPFSKEVADGELWLPTSKQAVVDMLVEALDGHASAVLVGEPGVGKTCGLRALRPLIPAAGFRLTYCHNATLGRRDFYRQLCHALGLTPATTAGSLFYALSRHVEDSAAERGHPVFLLDESHLLHQDPLDPLHILLNVRREAMTRPGIARGPP